MTKRARFQIMICLLISIALPCLVAGTSHAATQKEPIQQVSASTKADQSRMYGEDISPAKARSTLKNVLARKEFRTSPQDDWLARIIFTVLNAIGRLFDMVPGDAVEYTAWIVGALAVLLFAGVLVFLVLRYIDRLTNAANPDRAHAKERVVKHKKPSLESLIESAQQDAAAGRYKEAYRSVYLATILLLDRARLITHTESGTNWEYIRALRRQPPPERTDLFHEMTLFFDESIYGHGDVSEDDYRTSLQRFHRMEEMV